MTVDETKIPHAWPEDAPYNTCPLVTTGGRGIDEVDAGLADYDGDELDLLALYCTMVKVRLPLVLALLCCDWGGWKCGDWNCLTLFFVFSLPLL